MKKIKNNLVSNIISILVYSTIFYLLLLITGMYIINISISLTLGFVCAFLNEIYTKKCLLLERMNEIKENQKHILEELEQEKWYLISDKLPPNEVVLVACDTYDCGWTMDTAWYDEKTKMFKTTGAVKSYNTHLPYTHWRFLPKLP